MKRILILFLFIPAIVKAQNVPYGNNPAAGNYVKVKDGPTFITKLMEQANPWYCCMAVFTARLPNMKT